jgi:hypothetical protein
LTIPNLFLGTQPNNVLLGLPTFPRGITMHERVPPRGWIERRSIERHCAADTSLRVFGATLFAYGEPDISRFFQRGIWAAMALGVLTKPNRSRTSRSRKTGPNK